MPCGNEPEMPLSPLKTIRYLAENEKIYDLYQWREVLQEDGDGGKVVVCRPKGSQRKGKAEYVMKIRSKEKLIAQQYQEMFRATQIRLLNLPTHFGVLELHEVLEDDKFYYIIMERATGGSFFNNLLIQYSDGVIPEPAMRNLMREILEAISHVHQQGILHRDIKPDNLVMKEISGRSDSERPSWKVSLIDFDHAEPEWEPGLPAVYDRKVCGTVHFNAPETFRGCYSQSSDLYSVGVILYLLITGEMPFNDELYLHESQGVSKGWSNAVYMGLQKATIVWASQAWAELPSCKDFCRQLLAFDALKRPQSAQEALSHVWFRQDASS